MRKLISAETTSKVMLVIFFLLIIFHVLVILQVVPSTIVWGGRAAGPDSNYVQMEIFSIVTTFVFAGIVWGRWKATHPTAFLFYRIACWLMVLFFALGIVGNLMAESLTEMLIFTPVAFALTLGSLRLAIEPQEPTT